MPQDQGKVMHVLLTFPYFYIKIHDIRSKSCYKNVFEILLQRKILGNFAVTVEIFVDYHLVKNINRNWFF